MGLFNKLFNTSSESKDQIVLPWIPLTSLDQLNDLNEKSVAKTQIIFKHSTRCGISRMVLKQFEKDYGFSEKNVDLYYLDLIGYRDVSNAIASKFDVYHESPQLLVVKNGIVVAHASHGAINDLDLNRFI
ncbi:MAG: bacillithiol system redox-active protein YtxJ [Flavobacteriales bacterium]|nr:bacillithiol system redox-active protein YtxJ [Flavobacteriales bacterium]NCP88816.1 bacillithiol system redox-active protein YtxJ [Flavobacteriales bacterium]